MIYNIVKSEGELAAMELLDTLRSLRQTHSTFRMVFTGSIGLHAVMSSLKKAGHANPATNDMLIVDVPPLDSAAGEELARRLLDGARVPVDDVSAAARCIASSVDNLPYFIHHVIDRLAFSGKRVMEETIADTIRSYLTDPQDPWDLAHYRKRLDTYYEVREVEVALVTLDTLAATRDR